jgi:ribosome-associated protein
VREADKTKPRFVEGANLGRWVLIDYGDFILHVFTEECRRFYGLERLWGDAPDVTADYLPEAERERRQTGR